MLEQGICVIANLRKTPQHSHSHRSVFSRKKENLPFQLAKLVYYIAAAIISVVVGLITLAQVNIYGCIFIHSGFDLALDCVWDKLVSALRNFQDQDQSLWLTGHSLGAALTTLASAYLRDAGKRPEDPKDKPVNGLYTFGGPRAGDRDFESLFQSGFWRADFPLRQQQRYRQPYPASHAEL